MSCLLIKAGIIHPLLSPNFSGALPLLEMGRLPGWGQGRALVCLSRTWPGLQACVIVVGFTAESCLFGAVSPSGHHPSVPVPVFYRCYHRHWCSGGHVLLPPVSARMRGPGSEQPRVCDLLQSSPCLTFHRVLTRTVARMGSLGCVLLVALGLWRW